MCLNTMGLGNKVLIFASPCNVPGVHREMQTFTIYSSPLIDINTINPQQGDPQVSRRVTTWPPRCVPPPSGPLGSLMKYPLALLSSRGHFFAVCFGKEVHLSSTPTNEWLVLTGSILYPLSSLHMLYLPMTPCAPIHR